MNATDSANGAAPSQPNRTREFLAWTVHLLTASGAVWGLLAIFALMRDEFGLATIFMIVALGIDSIDGSFARKLEVSKYAPGIDGRRMDDIVDYLNFVIVPCVFMVTAGSVLSPYWVTLPALASAFGFSQNDAKTDDHFFLGWPSYWNILALYLWLLEITPLYGTLCVIFFSIAIFIPYKYIYPSRLKNRTLRYFVSYSGLIWALVIVWAVLDPSSTSRFSLVEISLLYPALYMGLSFKLGGLHRS
ncbi:MAG: hypothetical protein CL917_00310 [Deltaproteobacteria bacterium]|nr:hypothetical protein [Deltaproteobacteria bacterium]